MIADRIINKKRSQGVTELFVLRIKLNISLVFTTQPYFAILC